MYFLSFETTNNHCDLFFELTYPDVV